MRLTRAKVGSTRQSESRFKGKTALKALAREQKWKVPPTTSECYCSNIIVDIHKSSILRRASPYNSRCHRSTEEHRRSPYDPDAAGQSLTIQFNITLVEWALISKDLPYVAPCDLRQSAEPRFESWSMVKGYNVRRRKVSGRYASFSLTVVQDRGTVGILLICKSYRASKRRESRGSGGQLQHFACFYW